MINEVYVKIEGLNLFRIAQKLVDSGIMISNLKIKQSYMLFLINEKYLGKLRQVCKREHKYFYILKNTKIKRFFAKIPYLLGAFIPFVITFAVFYVFHNTVFSVNLVCKNNESYDLTELNNVLLKNNIIVGASKQNISIREVENLILKNSNNISGCKAYFEGLSLNIEVIMSNSNNDIQKIIKSKYDAILTQLEVFSGDSSFKVGDIIKKGDIIIKSEKESKGKVLGKVYFSSTRIYNEKQDEEIETGNIFQTTSYSIADIYNLTKQNECNYKNYNLEVQKINIIKNLILPIYKNVLTYKEIIIKEQIKPFSEVENQIKEELKDETINKLPNNAEVKNISYSVVKEDHLVRVDCFIETEISLI